MRKRMTAEQKIKHKQEMAIYRFIKRLDGEYSVLERPYFYLFIYHPAKIEFADMRLSIYEAYNEYDDVEYLFIDYDPYRRQLKLIGPRLNAQSPLSYNVKVKSKIVTRGLHDFPNNKMGIMTTDKKFGCLITGNEDSIAHRAENQIMTKTEQPSCFNCAYGATSFKQTNIVQIGCDNEHITKWDGTKCKYYEPLIADFCVYCGERIDKPYYEHQYWVGDPMMPYHVCSPGCQEKLLEIISFTKKDRE